MKIMKETLLISTLLLATLVDGATAATSGVKITEWMYNPAGGTGTGEFVEITNFGPAAVDFSAWSFDDNSRTPLSFSLSAFGLVASGESVLLTDATAADFRTAWGLGANVKVIGGNTENLGRSDEMNLYDATNTLVDQLTYNDQGSGAVAGPRTQGASGRATNSSVLGANTASQWVLSTVGDAEGSYSSAAAGGITGVNIGSPGKTSFVAAVPEPSSMAMGAVGAFVLFLFGLSRRRHAA